MKIPEYAILRPSASQRLEQAPSGRTIVLIYSLAVTAIALTVTVGQYILSLSISQTGGLSKIGLRSLLSSFSQLLPTLQAVVLMVLEFGYMAAILRISRGQYTSPNTLRAGIDRFWPLLRCRILKALIFLGICFAGLYLAMGIFMMSSLSDPLVALITPLAAEDSVLNPASLMLDEITQQALYRAMIPAFVIYGIVVLLLIPPLYYRYRMADYVLYDNPGKGAMFALRESRKMMRGNALYLLKLDLHMWWYYLLTVLIVIVAYGDALLPMLGIPLPFSDDFAFFLFYLVSLAIQFAGFYFLRNRVESVYAQAYNAIRPAPKSDGVVLGNIFQM